jgi:hypothetical protein
MLHSTQGLQLYSEQSDNKIGKAVLVPAALYSETTEYWEYIQRVLFKIDSMDEYYWKYCRWRMPKTGYCFWQFDGNIQNNDTGLVTVNCPHIMNGVYPEIHSIHRAKIGGKKEAGVLQPASGSLNVTVTRITSPKGYTLTVNSGQFVFQFEPDELTAENADEIDFETE